MIEISALLRNRHEKRLVDSMRQITKLYSTYSSTLSLGSMKHSEKDSKPFFHEAAVLLYSSDNKWGRFFSRFFPSTGSNFLVSRGACLQPVLDKWLNAERPSTRMFIRKAFARAQGLSLGLSLVSESMEYLYRTEGRALRLLYLCAT